MRAIILAVAFSGLLAGAVLADDAADAIEAGRKAYADGELAKAKDALGLASQLIGQKHAEAYAKLLPAPLVGWKADEVEITTGGAGYGASSALRRYEDRAGDQIEVQISSDAPLIAQFAAMMATREVAGTMGKIVMIGTQKAMVNNDGDVHIVVGNKYLVVVSGQGPANDKMAYARAVDIAKLSKM